jgi:hypothetical protein
MIGWLKDWWHGHCHHCRHCYVPANACHVWFLPRGQADDKQRYGHSQSLGLSARGDLLVIDFDVDGLITGIELLNSSNKACQWSPVEIRPKVKRTTPSGGIEYDAESILATPQAQRHLAGLAELEQAQKPTAPAADRSDGGRESEPPKN